MTTEFWEWLKVHGRIVDFALEPRNEAYSVKEAARILGVSKETVYKLIAEHALDCVRIGKRITITPEQLAAFQRR